MRPSSAAPRGGLAFRFPNARVVALAECGTHAFVAAEVDGYGVGVKPALRLYRASSGFSLTIGWCAGFSATALGGVSCPGS